MWSSVSCFVCVLEKTSASAIASDGRHLFIHNGSGLHKVGSGYGGTIKVR